MILAPLDCKEDCNACHGVCTKAGKAGYPVVCVKKHNDDCKTCRLRFPCFTGELEFITLEGYRQHREHENRKRWCRLRYENMMKVRE